MTFSPLTNGHGNQRIADVEVTVGADRDHGVHSARHNDIGKRPASGNADFLERCNCPVEDSRRPWCWTASRRNHRPRAMLGTCRLVAGVEREVGQVVGDRILDDL